MTEKLTTRVAIEHVLTGERKPMSVPAIFEEAFPLTGLLTSVVPHRMSSTKVILGV